MQKDINLVILTNGVQRKKKGKTFRSLVGRIGIVMGPSKKNGFARVILLGGEQERVVCAPLEELEEIYDIYI